MRLRRCRVARLPRARAALALCNAVDQDVLTVKEVRMHGNGAITPGVREQCKAPEIYRQGLGAKFRFEAVDTGSVFTQEGDVVPELK